MNENEEGYYEIRDKEGAEKTMAKLRKHLGIVSHCHASGIVFRCSRALALRAEWITCKEAYPYRMPTDEETNRRLLAKGMRGYVSSRVGTDGCVTERYVFLS